MPGANRQKNASGASPLPARAGSGGGVRRVPALCWAVVARWFVFSFFSLGGVSCLSFPLLVLLLLLRSVVPVVFLLPRVRWLGVSFPRFCRPVVVLRLVAARGLTLSLFVLLCPLRFRCLGWPCLRLGVRPVVVSSPGSFLLSFFPLRWPVLSLRGGRVVLRLLLWVLVLLLVLGRVSVLLSVVVPVPAWLLSFRAVGPLLGGRGRLCVSLCPAVFRSWCSPLAARLVAFRLPSGVLASRGCRSVVLVRGRPGFGRSWPGGDRARSFVGPVVGGRSLFFFWLRR